jgi:hypothetical protein
VTRSAHLRPQFVAFIPDRLEASVLYISRRYSIASHLCCCGCGLEVVTPLNPAKWHLIEHRGAVSLSPFPAAPTIGSRIIKFAGANHVGRDDRRSKGP